VKNVARMRYEKYVQTFGGKPEGKCLLSKHIHINIYIYILDDIKLNTKGVECEDVEWIILAQSRFFLALVNTVMNFRLSKRKKTGNFRLAEQIQSFQGNGYLRSYLKGFMILTYIS